MNIFTLFAIFSILTLLLGALIMWLVVGLSNTVVSNQAEIVSIEKEKQSINPTNTAGYVLPTSKPLEEKMEDARKLAARRAAAQPRGANMGIGRRDTTDARANKKVNSVGAKTSDPMSAVKIAEYHTWQGLDYKAPAVAGGGAAAPARGGGKQVKRKLVPGKDFAWTDFKGLSGAAKRTAIIANAKAKSAAYKAMKASGQDMMVAADTPAAAQAAPAAAAAPVTGLPPAPEYTEITDSMSAAEQRAAKIANSKAKSAYNKQLKAMGIDPKTVNAQAQAAAAPAAAAPVAEAAPAAPSGDLPPAPDMIEITDDMAPDDKRAAKIANSKAKSAYKKQLKAMGIDPKSVKI